MILSLGAVLLAASFPFYAALVRGPQELFFGPGVFVISQASVSQALTEELADDLREESWAVAVSPEVIALLGWSGQPLVVRGVRPEAFFALEGLSSPAPLGAEFLLVGERLAARFDLHAGNAILLPGSTHPVLLEAQVDGLLRARDVIADEMIMDLGRARVLAGLGGSALTLLRAEVSDAESLFAYLASTRRDVAVAGEGESWLVEDGLVLDDRIGSLVLTNPDLGRELGRGYVGSFAQHSGNSLSVLVLGMEALTLLLLGVMMASTLARFWVERRREVGILLSLGGGATAALRLFGTRLLALAVPATVAGFGAGIGIGLLLENLEAYAFLGHTLLYRISAGELFLMGALYLGSFALVVLLSLAFLLRQRPIDLLTQAPEPEWEGAADPLPLGGRPLASARNVEPTPNLGVDIPGGNPSETLIPGDHFRRPRS